MDQGENGVMHAAGAAAASQYRRSMRLAEFLTSVKLQ
jgi:hypothetical protein